MSSMEQVKNAYQEIVNTNGNVQIVLFQCTSSYPTPNNEIHLNVIPTFIKEFPNCIIGFSGHEKGIALSVCATALGARVIERHFTLDRTSKGNDHAASSRTRWIEKINKRYKIFGRGTR